MKSEPTTTENRVPPATATAPTTAPATGGNGHGDSQVDAHSTDSHDVAPAHTWKIILALCVLAAGFIALYFLGIIPQSHRQKLIESEAQAERERLPVVNTAVVKAAPADEDVALPGATYAIQEAGINSRTNGYLKKRYVDIGDVVKTGQLLAEIDTPEVDQQLSQAQAELAQARADVKKMQSDLALADATLKRYTDVGVPGGVSEQDLDVRRAAVVTAQKTVDAGQAAVDAKEADVRRLQNLTGFQKVFAPFAGRITARNVDLGSLITAGNQELFRLADVRTLRIFVSVPQTYSTAVQNGQNVKVTLREDPTRVFFGKVTRTSGSIDPASRTLRAEIQVDNESGQLLPGMYVVTHFTVHRDTPPLVIPSDAVLASSAGVRVAVVDAANKIHYRTVKTGRDYGDQIEILDGLKPGETIIANLSAGLDEGAQVNVPGARK